MAVIVERTFVGGYAGNDRAIQLRSEEYIRPLNVGDNWTKLRIAMLYGIDLSGTIPGLLDVGLCTNGNRGIASGNPIHYVGAGWGAGSTGRYAGTTYLWSYGTVTGNWAYSSTLSGFGMAQHGAVVDTYAGGASGNTYYIPNSGPNVGVYKRGIGIWDFQRTNSTTIVVKSYTQAQFVTTAMLHDYGMTDLISACEQAFFVNTITLSPYNLNTFVLEAIDHSALTQDRTLTYDQANGPLNAVNIAWSSTVAACTIYALAVAKHA